MGDINKICLKRTGSESVAWVYLNLLIFWLTIHFSEGWNMPVRLHGADSVHFVYTTCLQTNLTVLYVFELCFCDERRIILNWLSEHVTGLFTL
jgi:hypothetical protein